MMRILSLAIMSGMLAFALPITTAQACHKRCEAAQSCEPRHERHHCRKHHHHHDRCHHRDMSCKAAHTGDGSG